METDRPPNYTNTPASIVITAPDASILMEESPGGPHNDNSEFDHCIVLTTGSITYPIVLEPNTLALGAQDVRNMILNASTAVYCTADSCNIHDILIVGFDTGIAVDGSSHLGIRDVAMDADVGVFMTSMGSPALIDHLEMDPFLTHGLDTVGEEGKQGDRAISNVTSGTSGACRIFIDSTDFTPMTAGNPATGDSIDVSNIAANDSSLGPIDCNGRAVVTAVDSVNNTWIEIDKPYAAPSGLAASWSKGSNVISIAATAAGGISGIWPGETVTCSGCSGFPANAKVVDISAYAPATPGSTPYRIVLNKPTTAAGSTSGLFFGGTTACTSGCTGDVYLYPSLRPRAGRSIGGKETYGYDDGIGIGSGTCVQAGNATEGEGFGVRIVDSDCFGHKVVYAFWNGGPGGCISCSSDTHADVQDLDQFGVILRGPNVGNIGLVNLQIAAGGGIVLDETDTHCTNFSADAINPMTPGSIGFRAVNGCFSIAGMRSNLAGAPTGCSSRAAVRPSPARSAESTRRRQRSIRRIQAFFPTFPAPTTSWPPEAPATTPCRAISIRRAPLRPAIAARPGAARSQAPTTPWRSHWLQAPPVRW